MTTQQRIFQDEPSLRIKVAEGKEVLDLKSEGPFSVRDATGKTVFSLDDPSVSLRVSMERYRAPRFEYTLIVEDRQIFTAAVECVQKWNREGFAARLHQAGCEILIGGTKIGDNLVYQVRIGPFDTAGEAESLCSRFHDGRIVRETRDRPKAVFEIYDTAYSKSARFEETAVIVPGNPGQGFTLLNACHDTDERKGRYVRGGIHFLPDSRQGFITVADIPIETYLKHVLAAEMQCDYPVEALKSQAVASRSWTLSTLGLQHAGDLFDICCDSHCQLFCGKPFFEEQTARAVEETRGEVLYWKGQLCKTLYTPVCGGHTEDAILAGIAPPVSYLKGIQDAVEGKMNYGSLRDEDRVALWVSSQPDVLCNPRRRNGYPDDPILKAFRWELNYTRPELEKILQEKTGVDLGILFDIIPRKRGVSGRLSEVEILGSHRNLTLHGETAIRNAFSRDSLSSSCFIVEMDLGADGVPVEVSLVGAGHGLGVGLCQAGAVTLAAAGFTCEDILKHYFAEVSLKKLY
ncbi:MAG TPA: SpoIID/LytB domain-containing protein [bacterium]|nr:SpoIID/LytB domain-containing protein [bacterium]